MKMIESQVEYDNLDDMEKDVERWLKIKPPKEMK